MVNFVLCRDPVNSGFRTTVFRSRRTDCHGAIAITTIITLLSDKNYMRELFEKLGVINSLVVGISGGN